MYRSLFARVKRLLFAVVCVVLMIISPVMASVPVAAKALATPPWMDTALTADQRADLLLAQMTLDEKIALMHGSGGSYVGYIPANTRLGIPALTLEDGPAGVSDGMTQVTAFPAPVAGAASWDTTLMNQYGQAMASEEAGKGANIQLAPTVNILRAPQWGRSFESLGEDPYLTAQLGVADIQGIQSQGVMATVKHYAANNQEYNRTTVSDNVDERTLHEIYLPAFEAAVKQGNVGAVMCAYNKVNTIYACEQPYLQNQVLKQDWSFPGFIMSDWGATHSTIASANNGLDMQMPDDGYFGAALKTAVNNGQVSSAAINDHVHRILRSMFALGLFDRPATGSPDNNVTSAAHTQVARQVAEQGTVLLKNEQNVLPLDSGTVKSIAVIGADGADAATVVGGGSASVTAPYVVTPLQGISERAGSGVTVTYDSGANAAQVAQAASVAIVFVNDDESEGSDRSSLSLPNNQDQLIQTVAAANAHTIVVLNTGAPVLMPWVNKVQGVVEAWYPGQEDGHAIASILFGDVNPAGKLPMTFPVSASDVPANTTAQYPGINDQAQYSEGVFVGYRHYDAQSITPLFPFGHGLSYTSFTYSNLAIAPTVASFNGQVSVGVDVTNSGARAGSEVVQLYLGVPATNVAEPPRQLKGFQKIALAPGQTQHVTFTLDQRALSYWDESVHGWVVPQGSYNVQVGSSSRDIRVQNSFSVNSVPYAALQSAFNNVGTSDNSKPAAGNFDGSGYSYSAQALGAVGLTAGAVVTHNGSVFNWPDVAAGQPDNLAAGGQTVAYAGSGSKLAFLGAAAFGTQSGGATITYSDGTTQPFTLTFADWYANAAVGGDIVATASSWNTPAGSALGAHQVSVYYTSVALQAGKTVQYVTFPTNNNLHVFALATDNTLVNAYNNVGTSDDSKPAAGNFDGSGYSYSVQALAAVGLTPGGSVKHNGLTFTWPAAAAGQVNNVASNDQVIACAGSGSTLAFLGAATFGTQSGTVTVKYSDGSSQQFTLTFADWYANAVAPGDELIATATRWNQPAGSTIGDHAVSVYATAVSLQSGKAVQSVTLPANSNLHIFALSVG